MSGDLLNQREMADRLGRSPRTIRKWTDAGILSCVRDPESGWPLYSWTTYLERQAELGRIDARKASAA